jgi:hypothetical protein
MFVSSRGVGIRIIAAGAAWGVGSVLAVLAQQTPQESQPTFRVGVDVVQVDVSALAREIAEGVAQRAPRTQRGAGATRSPTRFSACSASSARNTLRETSGRPDQELRSRSLNR